MMPNMSFNRTGNGIAPWPRGAGCISSASLTIFLVCFFVLAFNPQNVYSQNKHAEPGSHTLAITVNGLERTHIAHVPATYRPQTPSPLVIMLHGGGRRPGVRITVLIPNVKGTIAQIAKAISNAGGHIVGRGTIEFPKSDNEMWECEFKVQGVSSVQLTNMVYSVVHEIIDIRYQ